MDEVARILTSILDIDQVYEKFALEMKKLVEFDRVSIHVVNQEEDTYTLRYLSGPARKGRPVGITSSLAGTQNQWVLTTAETLRRDDVANDLRFPSDREQLKLGMRANISVPMISKGRAIGVMGLRSRKAGAFGLREQVILERLARQIAPAIENAELYSQRKETEEAERLQTQQMEDLYNIASALAQPRSFEEKCSYTLEVLARIAQADAVSLRSVDEKDASLHCVAAVNPGNVEPPPAPVIRLGEGLSGLALQEGQPVVVNDYNVHPFATRRGRRRSIKSVVALPVKTGTQILGIITVVSKEANHFTPERVRMLLAVADGLGMLLENSRLSQGLQASAQEMAVVDEVARIITSTLEIDQVYEKFALEMKKLVDFDRASINFADQEAGTYTLLYLFGKSRPGRSIGSPSPLAGTYTEQVVKTKQTRITRDLAEDLEYPISQKWLKLGFRSNIIAPLISKGRAIGTLSLRSYKVDAFRPSEQIILDRLAHQIAPAVENARLYQQLQAHTK